MANFKVYNQTEEVEEEVLLALIKEGDCIQLVAVDKYGRCIDHGHILGIKSNGTFYRHPFCQVPGIKTCGPKGQIVEE